ncbi:MAG TPA: MerR family transcriptional regulator [Sphingomicrobium sp.]|nr:MerR family transcriptional regulator [Sphingomicrobium sp.]
MPTAGEKDPGALKTIGELAEELGVAQHILRYWETRFPQLKPMQRAGNRRYYRPADVELARRIHRLLNEEGYTVRGVQKLLRERHAQALEVSAVPREIAAQPSPAAEQPASSAVDVFRLIELRNRLADALDG